MGKDVMCNNELNAYRVASVFPNYIGKEIDKYQKPGNTYYWHFHPDRNSHIHIWYYQIIITCYSYI